MKTREEYDEAITNMQNALGDDFSKISSIVADLSTDYDSIIQSETDYKAQIDKITAEKIQLLETNNDLFRKVTNKSDLQQDPVITQEEQKIKDENEKIAVDDFMSEEGGLD